MAELMCAPCWAFEKSMDLFGVHLGRWMWAGWTHQWLGGHWWRHLELRHPRSNGPTD